MGLCILHVCVCNCGMSMTLLDILALLVRCPDFRGCSVHKLGVWDSQMCPVYWSVLIQDILNEGCPNFKGCNVHKWGTCILTTKSFFNVRTFGYTLHFHRFEDLTIAELEVLHSSESRVKLLSLFAWLDRVFVVGMDSDWSTQIIIIISHKPHFSALCLDSRNGMTVM